MSLYFKMIFKEDIHWHYFTHFLTPFLISVISLNPFTGNCLAQLNNSSTANLAINSSNSTFDYKLNSTEATRPHYAISPFSTQKLALWEEHLVQNLTQIINASTLTQNDPCSLSLINYLRGFHKDVDPNIKSHQRAKHVTKNPILTFRMIRRVFVDLQNDTKSACQNSHPEIVDSIENAYDENMTPVTSQDLDDALWGLLRIQYIYGFNATTEMRFGIFNGVKTGASLSHEDCVTLAKKAIEIKAYNLAYQWLVSASLSTPQNTIKPQYTQNDSCLAVESESCDKMSGFNSNEESEYSRLWADFLNYVSKAKLPEMLKDKPQMIIKGQFYTYPEYATCRGENKQTVEEQSKLTCYYARSSDPYFYINPIKTEMLSKDPLIFQFYELIGDKTIELISNATSKYMLRSAINHPTKREAVFTARRTSMNGWLRDAGNPRAPKKLVALNRRVEKLLGLEVVKKFASECQVVLYGSLGGHYDFHDDAFQGIGDPKFIANYGDRIATLLFFMSNVTMGGYTAFPKAGIFAKPIKGSAVLWYNLHRNGTGDSRLKHGGCPVILGTKHAANRWIYESENMWRHPCLLDSMA